MNCNSKLFFKVRTFNRNTHSGIGLISVQLIALHHFTKYHFRVVSKVFVYSNPIFKDILEYPFRCVLLYADRIFSLLQENNIRCDFCSCVLLKRCIRQTYRTEQFCTFSKIFSDLGTFLVKRTLWGHKCYYSPRAYFVKSFGKEIIVNIHILIIIVLVIDFIAAKRHIADRNVKAVVFKCCIFIALYLNICRGIKQICNTSCYAVKLNTWKFGVITHFFGHRTEKVSRSECRFKNLSAIKSHIFKSRVNRVYDSIACKVCIECRCPCRSIFFRREKPFQLRIFITPVVLTAVKRICQATPTNIFCKYLLFFGGSTALFTLHLFQKAYSSDIVLTACLISAKIPIIAFVYGIVAF